MTFHSFSGFLSKRKRSSDTESTWMCLGVPTRVQKAGYLGANLEEGEDFAVWGSKRDGLCREMGTIKASSPLPFSLSDGQ